MSSTPKLTAAILSLLTLALLSGCIRHPNSRTAEERAREISAAREIMNDERPDADLVAPLPGDRLVSSSTGPTTSRYLDTQPTAFRPTRIVLRVGERGLVRRQWPLETTYRPSGDVLAGPNYWPSIDRAVQRPNSTNVWLEPLEFLYNVALLPYRAIETPPWSKIVYSPSGGVGWRNVEQSGVIFQEKE